MQPEIGKVTAFITRDTSAGCELLVFTHPDAGIQVPAGTMEAGEARADYVAFGAFYPTMTKETHHRPEPEIVHRGHW